MSEKTEETPRGGQARDAGPSANREAARPDAGEDRPTADLRRFGLAYNPRTRTYRFL